MQTTTGYGAHVVTSQWMEGFRHLHIPFLLLETTLAAFCGPKLVVGSSSSSSSSSSSRRRRRRRRRGGES